ncbi:MAG: Transcription elongation factor GreA [Chlamydiae bacterium]|nr:Transcription elongation factor GreA [Chlamydiota bacterium]
MSYLEEFQYQINNRDFHKFFQLWEEYCTSDCVDTTEFLELLEMIKNSDFAKLFGQFVETALPLWKCVEDKNDSYKILKLLIDLQTTNAPILADIAFQALEEKFGDDANFRDNIRMIGLRTRESFQGAISNYELLNHLKKGSFVFHSSGWDTGEVMDVSRIREQAAIEFESVTGIKHLTFDNAFKTLIPLTKDHFLARRFADPDLLEEQARKDSLEVVKALLRDLGSHTASEIKEELCELVIPEKDWTKWWQGARAKLKKDTMVESPSALKHPFRLRKSEITHEDRLHKAIEKHVNLDDIIQTSYSFVRDHPHMFRKEEGKDTLKNKLLGLLSHEELTQVQELQIAIFLESFFGHKVEGRALDDFIQRVENVEGVINKMDILAFKKRALVMIREHRKDWLDIFLSLFFTIQQNTLRDYFLTELNTGESKELILQKLRELLKHPEKNPEVYVWYFQKLVKLGKSGGDLPFSDKEGRCQFFEGFLILLHKIEHDAKYRDLTKKMYNMLIAKRYATVRFLIEGTTLEFIKEFLLLVSKCHTFTDHDKKILRSLAIVVHPSLSPKRKRGAMQFDHNVIWTTEEGYQKIQERIKQIGTVEMIENAREVEAAREHGDLRENAEYKFAVERRSRLQGEMKDLSKQLNKARILTKDDTYPNEVGVGSVVDLEDSKGNAVTYTILGPWETNPENYIISYQSQFAEALLGNKIGDKIKFRDEEYKVVGLKTFLQ